MRKLILLTLLLATACSDDSTNPGPGSGSNPGSNSGSDQAEFTCFSGTVTNTDPATTHDQIINKCADVSVTAIVKYKTLKDRTTALPLLHSDGTRPILP